MKKTFLLLTIILTLALSAMSQTQEQTKPANPADVASIDAIIKAVYDVISGDAGAKRDWDRFRTLFHKDARLIPTGKNPKTNVYGANVVTPEDYIKRTEPFFNKEGFHEREIARTTEIYGNIAHVFSTYETFKSQSEMSNKKPFMRGINSIQLLNDGTRWWIISIYWQAETPDNPLPKKYLKSRG
ncbi:MAG TPA: hypothetical protein VK892_15755 [Pyrinomonadaceae bacterium]|nr:hypothetical protein [Pyrinomonadaceae bacterium]